jgi:hypothetical protein
VYVPDVLDIKADLLREHHDISIAGHLGFEKTVAALTERYYWPGMFADVRESM